MGVHFLNTANIGPQLDPAKPQVLIYEPVGGKLKLVAAEWFMPVAVAGGKAPSIFGQTLDGPMDGHEPIMPAELHALRPARLAVEGQPEGRVHVRRTPR